MGVKGGVHAGVGTTAPPRVNAGDLVIHRKLVSALHALGGNGHGPVALGRVKPSLAPVRNEMLNASGSRRIIMENLSR